jgi:hypothetical protein
MKKSILILIAVTMLSCGYNIKTDNEIARDSYQIVEAQDELNEVKQQWKQLKDSVAMVVIKDRLRLERFKDSVQFTQLSRTMCYNNREHRHSCEVYGNSLIKATKEAINEQPDQAINEQTEVAIN